MVPPKRQHPQEQEPTSYGRYSEQWETEVGGEEEHTNEPPSEFTDHASASTSGRSHDPPSRGGGGQGEGRGEFEGAEEAHGLTDRHVQHAAGRRLLSRYTSAQNRISLRAESTAQALGDDLGSTENVRLSSGEPTAGGSQSQLGTTSQRSRGKDGSAPAVCVPLPPPPHITASSPSPTAHAEESNLSTTLPDSRSSLRGATGEDSHPRRSHRSGNAPRPTPAFSSLSSERPSPKRQDREARHRAQRSAIPSSTGTTVSSPSARSPSLPASMREGGTQGDQQRVPSPSRSVETYDLHRRIDVPTSRRYLLHILQQPSTGSAFGSHLLSRLAIAPPLVVQLQAVDAAGRDMDIDDQMPLLVCQVSLRTRNDECADMLTASNPSGGIPDASTTQGTASTSGSKGKRAADKESSRSDPPGQADDPDPPSVRLLYGSLIASARRIQLVDPPRSAIVFVFPEVSIRSRGQFRLRIDLHRLNIPLPAPSISASHRLKTAAPPPPSKSASLSIIPQPSSSSSSLLSTSHSSSAQQASSSSSSSFSSTSASSNGSLLATALTEIVTVVLPAQYVAPHVTDLTRHLASQGVALLLPPSSQNVE